jgi:chromosome segregation ATPase
VTALKIPKPQQAVPEQQSDLAIELKKIEPQAATADSEKVNVDAKAIQTDYDKCVSTKTRKQQKLDEDQKKLNLKQTELDTMQNQIGSLKTSIGELQEGLDQRVLILDQHKSSIDTREQNLETQQQILDAHQQALDAQKAHLANDQDNYRRGREQKESEQWVVDRKQSELNTKSKQLVSQQKLKDQKQQELNAELAAINAVTCNANSAPNSGPKTVGPKQIEPEIEPKNANQ